MINKEKTIRKLEEISDYFFNIYHHSKDREEINRTKDMCDVVEDALALLKEQKVAIKPKNVDKVGGNCPVCGLRMARTHKYCYQCGQKINWND